VKGLPGLREGKGETLIPQLAKALLNYLWRQKMAAHRHGGDAQK
jgi:hypothetical protein